jgi:hypothetical protein
MIKTCEKKKYRTSFHMAKNGQSCCIAPDRWSVGNVPGHIAYGSYHSRMNKKQEAFDPDHPITERHHH